MIARLVFPALRWTDSGGYGLADAVVGEWLDAGVGGFLLFGGRADAAREAVRELRQRAGHTLLFGADLERGAGQQFRGLTSLPPALALAYLGADVVREAAHLTATEARGVGVRWIYAPVADVASEPRNPIVSTRALGRDPESAAAGVEAWVSGALEAGGLPCLKHFPGHGRTTEDSHATLPVIEVDVEALEADLAPFRAGLAAGVPSVMTAHVAYSALDPTGVPATRSRPIVDGLLRQELDFQGVIATDALIMEGAGSAEDAGVEAIASGVDALLYPPDPGALIDALGRALSDGRLPLARITAARTRLEHLAELVGHEGPGDEAPPLPAGPDTRARLWADRALEVPPGWPLHHGRVELMVVDDDVGGPYPPPDREALSEALRAGGVSLVDGFSADTRVVAVFADPRGWKGRAGLSEAARRRGRDLVAGAGSRPTGVILFGDPAWATDLPAGVPVLRAWGGEPLMQAAAGATVAERREG